MMIFYPTQLQMILVVLLTLCVLGWMGDDQLQDEAKTAEVMAEIAGSQTARHTAHISPIDQLERDGRSMTGYDQIKLATAKP
jgi:hypothetical protein